ncbi:MAG TPA: molybdopterin-dependent oxidoreductase [Xanthobacteraceae bacterium]|jgi:DMSO/TMAO reductase YedYZ molybdopterin-dependent catalytic subunit|nr:molybdopterin-dependent oxidoreductase [Xanthobacteraceae bacterium]
MIRRPKILSASDANLLVKDAAKLLPDPTRRLFLRGAGSVGALALLTGCDIIDGQTSEQALRAVSRFNDRVQAWLFNPNRLAPSYPESAITRPFPFNGFYDEDDAPDVDAEDYKLAIGGLVSDKSPWTLDRLYALPQETQITRHVCIEGWSAVGKWTGVPLREFLNRIGADTNASYVFFRCAEGYTSSIDMPTALHPQTQVTFKFDDKILTRKYGFPIRIRIPTKLGFKSPKYVVEMSVTNEYRGGYWENQGYNWFSGL